jgi:DNA-binding transcriptional MocR family regulator
MMRLPDTQLALRPGVVEFGWGHPHPSLLPVAELAAAAGSLAARGADALGYGPAQGPGSLIAQIQARLGRLEGAAPPSAQLMITGGISQALDMLCAQLSRPGDAVLVEAPTYHLALRIFADRGLRVVAVAGDQQGLQVDAAEATLRALRARGQRVAFLYVVASFGNPSGATLSAERRAALAALSAREGLPVLEDDAYRELWYDAPPPPALFGREPGAAVVRLGSYAKILAPGLRLGWMLAQPELLRRCMGSGVLDSGGGVNHFAAMALAALIERGFLDEHVGRLRETLRGRRDVLLAALARFLPAGCSWNPALGGYFVWVRLPEGLDASALLPEAVAAGVGYLPGARFFVDEGGASFLRLSFSLLPPDALEEGARRLGSLLTQAAQRVV